MAKRRVWTTVKSHKRRVVKVNGKKPKKGKRKKKTGQQKLT